MKVISARFALGRGQAWHCFGDVAQSNFRRWRRNAQRGSRTVLRVAPFWMTPLVDLRLIEFPGATRSISFADGLNFSVVQEMNFPTFTRNIARYCEQI